MWVGLTPRHKNARTPEYVSAPGRAGTVPLVGWTGLRVRGGGGQNQGWEFSAKGLRVRVEGEDRGFGLVSPPGTKTHAPLNMSQPPVEKVLCHL